jgi:hypothetical protein
MNAVEHFLARYGSKDLKWRMERGKRVRVGKKTKAEIEEKEPKSKGG